MGGRAYSDPKIIAAKQDVFLKSFADVGIVLPACEAAGISRSTYYKWRDLYEEFDIACEEALQEAIDRAEMELRTRAVQGIEEPVLFKGEPVWKRDPNTGDILLDDDFNPIPFTINRRSDRLLEIYMKAQRQQYRDKGAMEISGPGGGAIEANFEVTYVLPAGKTEDDYKLIEHGDNKALGYTETGTEETDDVYITPDSAPNIDPGVDDA